MNGPFPESDSPERWKAVFPMPLRLGLFTTIRSFLGLSQEWKENHSCRHVPTREHSDPVFEIRNTPSLQSAQTWGQMAGQWTAGPGGERENCAADDSAGGAPDMCCSERLSGLPQPIVMEALDKAKGHPDTQREMPPPSPPSEPAQKPPPQGAGSHSLTVRSSLCLFAASQFLLACVVLWFSGYGHIWLQNATDLLCTSLTLLTQLGPTASLGTRTWGIPSLLLVSLSVGLVLVTTTLLWHVLKPPPEAPSLLPPEDRRQSVSRQPSFTYSEWMEDKVEDDFLDLDPVPETPVFDCVMDIKPEADPTSLTVKSMGLQERRGSNVSLTLDMCTPGCNEEGFGYLVSPREELAHEYLLSASRVLRAEELHEKALDPFLLQAEFFEIPMNFVDPKEYDIPGLVRKNRYRTILPNPHSRVCLTSPDPEDPLSSYINANYIRGYRGEEKVYIATQGPIVSTVADFWRMVWQEHTPIIVMITNIEEMNEKCTEYWPEEQVVYDGVEITVQKVIHTEDYRLRLISLREEEGAQRSRGKIGDVSKIRNLDNSELEKGLLASWMILESWRRSREQAVETARLGASVWDPGRGVQKCTEYWPEEQVVYDGVEITVQKVIHTEDYRLRLISLREEEGAQRSRGKIGDVSKIRNLDNSELEKGLLASWMILESWRRSREQAVETARLGASVWDPGRGVQSGTEKRGLKHYWFTSWPDQKTPDRAPPLLHLVREVEEAAQQEGPRCAPIIVHCSAGIGRTGCFIATSICCQQLRHEGVVDILKTTCQLRQDRGGMIQTCEQYQFVHHVMSLYEKQLSRQSPE
ncbi:Tyrosine-protein phosphatase non-receptor type 5 [Heterocephalus glaber]|uniref:protein-tyrosine-phosphatase n=1 Tax=Heterocephalus glaber TaxID=10181 RepID=G5AK96_HETGA|nr:Tyrosine-protein phosphatase non-receptor type 5 [Heterocephalus glaber]